MKWEDNILGFVPKKDWLDIDFQPKRQNDPVDVLLGDKKTDNLVAEWETIASEYQVPVMAQFHGFDTESKTTFRIPVDNHNIEKGLIKVKINQSERLRALTRAGVQGDEKIYEYVIKDGVRLADQVFTRSKVAKNEMLATGKVTIKENDLDLTVDYGVPADQTEYSITFTADSDVPGQIQTIIDAAIEKGITINGILTSSKVLTKIRGNKAMQTVINGTTAQGATVRLSQLKEYFNEEYGISQVITNDLTYGASAEIGRDGRPEITTKRYYPDNKITFFATNPGGKLGTGLWGDAPEVDAAKFMQTSTEASVSPYVCVSQWMEKDPAVLWTKASGLFMPVLYNPGSLFIATTSESEG